jgi:photosystem II stability/assembly factor-like uncharacterized protein
VYAGTNFDGVFRSRADRHGRDWRPTGHSVLLDCDGQNGHALAIDPSDPGHVFFSTNDGGLLETRTGGLTWKDGERRVLSRAPRSIAFDPHSPRRVHAGSFTGGGFFRSEHRGQYWERRLFGTSAIYVADVDVDPVNHTSCTLQVRPACARARTAAPRSWLRARLVPPGIPMSRTGEVLVNPEAPWVLYVGTEAAGVFRSMDGGESWAAFNDGLDDPHTYGLAMDPRSPDTLYASTSSSVYKYTTTHHGQ